MTSPATNIRPRDPRLDPAKAGMLAKAREEWESRTIHWNTRIFASFDDMLEAFASDCMSWTDIGIALDVSRERVRQIYRDYFAQLFGRTKHPGWKRQRICTINRRSEKIKELVPIGRAALIASHAAANGITVQAVPRNSKSSVLACKSRLILNGKLVSVRASLVPSKTNPRSIVRYFRFPHPADAPPCDFVVLYAGKPLDACFVMPRDVFIRWEGGHLPERPNTYELNAHLGQTAWIWQYENAWHLLRSAT